MVDRAQSAFHRGVGLLLLAAFLIPLNQKAEGRAKHDYLHSTTVCLQAENGPGIMLLLYASESGSPTLKPYPYLELDIRERSVATGKTLTIGPKNGASRCPSERESCEQALSGMVVFDTPGAADDAGRYEPILNQSGHYELKFKNKEVEGGHFKVDGFAPCP